MRIPADTPNRYRFWIEMIHQLQPGSMAEIGVWKGVFASKILRDGPSIKQYTMIDPWQTLPDWNKPYNVRRIAGA